jgi:hypothetical protein
MSYFVGPHFGPVIVSTKATKNINKSELNCFGPYRQTTEKSIKVQDEAIRHTRVVWVRFGDYLMVSLC